MSGLRDAGSSCWSGVELRVMCPVCGMLVQVVGLVWS